MNKSKILRVKVSLTVVYCILAIIAVVCLKIFENMFLTDFDTAVSIFKIGDVIGTLVIIVLPIILVPVNLILSIIGIIKNKKFIPYLLCIPFSVVAWIITVSYYAPYMRT